MQAVVAQQQEYDEDSPAEDVNGDDSPEELRENEEFPEQEDEDSENDENIEPVHQVDMSVHEDLEMEQDADGNIVHAEVDADVVSSGFMPEDAFHVEDDNVEDDGLVSETSRPSAVAAIFS
jgi:hypothetical protein